MQLPTCPLCGTFRVQEIGKEGLQQQLTVLQCAVCDRVWRELICDDLQAAGEEQELV
jgi:hypothetical protein